jgi:hypothetical protein
VGQNQESFPDQVINYFKSNHLQGNVYNTQQVGAFLTYHLYPDILVMADTRDDLFLASRVYQDQYNVDMSVINILPVVNFYKVNYVLGDLNSGSIYQTLFQTPDWDLVYLKDNWFILARREIVEQKNLKPLIGLDPFSGTGAKRGQEKAVLELYQNNYLSNPKSFFNAYLYAISLYSNGSINQALQVAIKIPTKSGPGSRLTKVKKFYLISQLNLEKGDCQNAYSSLNQAIKETKGAYLFDLSQTIPIDISSGIDRYNQRCQMKISS